MKTAKITAVFLSLFTALFLMTAVYASGITTDHTHCLCGSTVHGDNSNHDDLESKFFPKKTYRLQPLTALAI